MAIFNPQLEKQEKEFTRDSQGFYAGREVAGPPVVPADRSAEIKARGNANFVKGIAGAVGDLIEGTDSVIKKYIGDSLAQQKQGVDDEFGVAAAATMQQDIAQATLPKQIQDAGNDLAGLTNAYQSGRLKESHYYARLESAVRQMKARFPGYREEIDSMISSIAGTTPANALRRALQSEAEDAARVRAQDPLMKEIDQQANTGVLDVATPDWRTKLERGELTVQELYSNKAKVMKNVWTRDQNVAILNEKAKRGENVEKEATQALQQEGYGILQDFIRRGTIQGFGSAQELVNRINVQLALASDKDPNTEPDPKEMMALTGAIQTMRTNVMAQMDDRIINAYSGMDGGMQLSDEGIMKAKRAINSYLDTYAKALTNKEWNMLEYNASLADGMFNSAKAHLFQQDEMIAKVAVLKDTLGSDYVLANDARVKDRIDSVAERFSFTRLLTGEGRSLQEEILYLKTKGVTDPNAFRALQERMVKAIGDDDLRTKNPKEWTKAVEATFGPGNRTMMAGLPREDQIPLYRIYTSPEVRETMEKGGSKEWIMYKNWVKESAGAIFKQDIDDLKNTIVSENHVNIQYDEVKHRLYVDFFPSFRKLNPEDQETIESRVKGPVDKINQELAGLGPILEKDRENVPDVYLSFLQSVGYNEGAVKEGSMMRQIVNAFNLWKAEQMEPGESKQVRGATKP
jgi:hypothetical protein